MHESRWQTPRSIKFSKEKEERRFGCLNYNRYFCRKYKGIANGHAEGIANDRAEGIANGRTEAAHKMIEAGFPRERVLEILGLTAEDLQ